MDIVEWDSRNNPFEEMHQYCFELNKSKDFESKTKLCQLGTLSDHSFSLWIKDRCTSFEGSDNFFLSLFEFNVCIYMHISGICHVHTDFIILIILKLFLYLYLYISNVWLPKVTHEMGF